MAYKCHVQVTPDNPCWWKASVTKIFDILSKRIGDIIYTPFL